MKKNDPRLCVVSSDGKHWNALTYGDRGDDTINFKIRTYLPGRLDDRLNFFKTAKTLRTLARHLTGKHKESPIIAQVAHVKQITNFMERDFAPVL